MLASGRAVATTSFAGGAERDAGQSTEADRAAHAFEPGSEETGDRETGEHRDQRDVTRRTKRVGRVRLGGDDKAGEAYTERRQQRDLRGWQLPLEREHTEQRGDAETSRDGCLDKE